MYQLALENPNIEIEGITDTTDGWAVAYFDKIADEPKSIAISWLDFSEWLSDLIFEGYRDKKTKTEDYIINNPEWTQDYLKEYAIKIIIQ